LRVKNDESASTVRRGFVFRPCRSPLPYFFQGDSMSVMNLKNGALRNLDLEQINDLLQVIDGKVSQRKRYLKVALLAAMSYDCETTAFHSASEIATRAGRYTNKNCGMTSNVAGNLLGNMYRMGLVARTSSPPYQYKLREGVVGG